MKRLSIKWKIFIYLLGFCALLLLILWLFQVVFLNAFYQSIKVNDIKDSANTIAKNIDDENLTELVDSISQNSDICIEVITSSGGNIYSSDVLRDCIIHRITVAEKLRLISNAQDKNGEFLEYLVDSHAENSEPFKILTDTAQKASTKNNGFNNMPSNNTAPMRSIIYVKLAESSSGETIAIILNSSISPVNATVTTLRYQLYYVTGIMILLSVLLAILIAKRVSKPIEKINECAKILAKGDYNITFSDTGYKEIGELSDTLNTAAKELSKVEGLRRELIANVSHDLRTPLTLISGYAEAIRDIPGDNINENAQIIIDESKRVTVLVNDMLDLSKIEAGINDMNIERYNLTENMISSIQRLNGYIEKDGYVISLDYDNEAFVKADKSKISQVLYNLLINAINYSGSDKKISVCQKIIDNKVKIEISDSGEGIAAEELPYIWDRYYKANKTHKRAVTGTGLGLSIVKKIIEGHGGEYGVISDIGVGSTFWFSLKIV